MKSSVSPAPVDDATPWWRTVTGYQWFVFAIVSAAWLFDTMDQRLFSLARIPALASLMALPASHIDVQAFAKVATALYLIGWGVGGLTFGPLGDRYGRVRLLTLAVLIYSLCSGLTALCRTPLEFALLRLLSGIGTGGVFGLAVAILADTVPGRQRLAMLAGLQLLSTLGNVGSAFVKMGIDALASHGTIAAGSTWRWLFVIGMAPALITLFSAGGMREPDPWLELKAAGRLPKGPLGAYVELLHNSEERKGLLIGSLLAIAGVVGLWGIGEYAVDLQHAVFTSYFGARLPPEAVAAAVASTKNWSFLLQMAGGAVGMLVFVAIADRLGRRPAFLSCFAAAFAITLFVYSQLQTPFDAYWMMPLMGAAQFSLFAGFSIYLPELFGSRVRGTGVSFSYNLGRFAAAGGSFGSAWLSTALFGGFPAPAPLRFSAMTMCAVFLVGLVAAWYAPETRGRPLPR
jgi:MFS family permease